MLDRFMLSRDEIYLNAGTFSALPRVVYDRLVQLISSAEANPTRVAAQRKREPLWQVQERIAAYLGAEARDLVFEVNVTEALNAALLGYPWPRGGELLIAEREYPSIIRAAETAAARRGMTIRRFDFPEQPGSDDQLVDAIEASLSERTAGVLISHVGCTNGQVTPLKRIAALLSSRDIRLVVDGAHGPGLIPLSLADSGVDFYGGNLHKWFMGPKGTGFVYVRRDLHERMEPNVVGFDGTMVDDGRPLHEPIAGIPDRFPCVFRLHGLRDVSPFLALDATLQFREEVGEAWIMERVAALCTYVRERLGLPVMSPPPPFHAGLVTVEPPAKWRVQDATQVVYDRHKITVPIWRTNEGRWIMRVSPHIWNSEADIDRLAEAVSS